MREEFLHYAWQHQLFNKEALVTKNGQEVSVYFQGYHSHHSEPYFLIMQNLFFHLVSEVNYFVNA